MQTRSAWVLSTGVLLRLKPVAVTEEETGSIGTFLHHNMNNSSSRPVAKYEWRFADRFGGMPSSLEVSLAPNAIADFAPVFTSSVEWERKGEWVPTKWMISENQGELRYNISIQWKTVNGPMGEKTFDYRGFGVAPGTRLVDTRSDPPKTELVIGK